MKSQTAIAQTGTNLWKQLEPENNRTKCHDSMSQDFALQLESLITRLQPIRLEVLQAEQHFRQDINRVNWATFKAREIWSIK